MSLNKCMEISVGIITYNDCGNIESLVKYFSQQSSPLYNINEIFVVTTEEVYAMKAILRSLEKKLKILHCIYQRKRKGKTSAINEFLRCATSPILVVCSGDVHPAPEALRKLVEPFKEHTIGMTGGQIVPLYSEKTSIGRFDMLLWKLHHCMALTMPKLGEMVVFRNEILEIPENITVDEAYIEYTITTLGYKLKYVPEAFIYNSAYTRLHDYLSKRFRIGMGHGLLRKKYGYKVASECYRIIILIWIKSFFSRSIKEMPYFLFVTLGEVGVRFCTFWHLFLKNPPFVWHLSRDKQRINILKLLHGKE